jgi:hypothetical protein
MRLCGRVFLAAILAALQHRFAELLPPVAFARRRHFFLPCRRILDARWAMPARPRILIATAKPGFDVISGLFGEVAETVYAFTLGDAIHHLGEGRIDLILCTIHFDESRMFDFVRYARSIAPSVPIVCTRLLDTRLSGSLLDAMIIAAESLGATFIDRHALIQQLGEKAGDEEFRKRVLLAAKP